MLIPTLVMGVLAIILVFIAFQRGGGEHIEGLKLTKDLLIQVVPLLIFAFIVAGMVQVLPPHKLFSKWIGAESGMRGILIGTVVGGLTPGGPYVTLPIAAGVLHAGASIRYYGRIHDSVVALGNHAPADGNRHHGLGIHSGSHCLYILFPTHRRAVS